MSESPDNLVPRLLRDIRREMTDQRTLLLAIVDQGHRLERRMGEMARNITETKDDIELMLKAELMGRMGNFESRFEDRLDRLERPGDTP